MELNEYTIDSFSSKDESELDRDQNQVKDFEECIERSKKQERLN